MRAISTATAVAQADQQVNGSSSRWAHRLGDRLPRWSRSRALPLVELLAFIPALAMLRTVLRAPKLQLPDYWIIAPETFNGDGSLAVGSLLSYYNGHILGVPKVLYWLNYELNSGLNSSLGLWVILIAIGQVLLMRALLPRSQRWGPWVAPGLVVGIAVLVFAPQGTHNYVMAMSGAAWILANLFTAAAVWLATWDRSPWVIFGALPLAALATVTYGTGVMAWPALLVVIFLRERGRGLRWLASVTSVLAVGAYAFFYERPSAHGGTGLDIVDVSRRVAQVLGSLVAPDADSAAAVGVAAMALGAFVVWRVARTDRHVTAPWVALLLYGFLGAAMIGAGRGGHDSAIGGSGRYAPVSAVFLASLLVLVIWLWPRDARVGLAAVVAVGIAFVSGRVEVDHVEERNYRLEEVAIAARLGTVYSYSPAPGYAPNAYEERADYFRGFAHYPFSDSFDYDCGMLGQQLDLADVQAAAEATGATGELRRFNRPYNTDAVRLGGWAHSPDGVRCVLVVDEKDLAVGAAVYGIPQDQIAGRRGLGTTKIGFSAVAPKGSASYRVIAVVGPEQRLVLLPGELQAANAPVHPAASGASGSTETTAP